MGKQDAQISTQAAAVAQLRLLTGVVRNAFKTETDPKELDAIISSLISSNDKTNNQIGNMLLQIKKGEKVKYNLFFLKGILNY